LGYHVVNLAIHIGAALVLFGIVRLTLNRRYGPAAPEIALATAVLWMIHPLQTESVTYIIQRTESLMGFFYLLTLYCVIRGSESDAPVRWYGGAVAACLLGMGTKEVMVTAPVIVLLYDRTFLAGSFREAWRKRWRLYLGLAATWMWLAYLAASAGNRGGSAGLNAGVAWQKYALTQIGAVTHYLRLCIWPVPLVFDYGDALTGSGPAAAFIIGLLLAGTLVALWRWPVVGFLGAWFFIILAPSSSIVPVASQTMAEHRMYLPLAAVVALSVGGGLALGLRGKLAWGAAFVVGALLMASTQQRNLTYDSEAALWLDTVNKCPGNSRAHNNLGMALARAGHTEEAVGHFEQAIRLKPDFAAAQFNLSGACLELGRDHEAVEHFERALQLQPNDADTHFYLALTLERMGQIDGAVEHYERALALNPGLTAAQQGLARLRR
jgi:tetratricopeptide (TPR) repeat protein